MENLHDKYIAMLKAQETGDIEADHSEYDEILCALLIELGYEDVVKVYAMTDKWYA